jgi:hypothetical protein
LIWQLHHQFKDHTEFVAQKEFPNKPDPDDFQTWLEGVSERHPLSQGATWLACNEKAPEFMRQAKELR